MRTTLYILPGNIPIAGPNTREARALVREARTEVRSDPDRYQEVIRQLEKRGFARPGA